MTTTPARGRHIYIIAPNAHAARRYTKEHNIHPQDAQYVYSSDILRGHTIIPEQIVYLPGYDMHPLWDDIRIAISMTLARSGVRAEDRVPPPSPKYRMSITDREGRVIVERMLTERQLGELPA